MLSHELRNPLMPMRNGLFILEHAAPASEQARRAQSVMRRQVDHLARLIDDLLDVMRISRGKMQMKREMLDLRELVQRTVEDHRPAFEHAGVSLQVTLTETVLEMSADRTRLAQVVSNLLQNATKFTPRGGHVWLTLEREPSGKEALLRVRDDGCGIDAHMLTHLFEPFSQAGLTLDRSRTGLGLGLSLVKGIVELHGGSIAGSSEGPGKGAEFSASFPLEASPVEAVEFPRPEPRPHPRRVLIIEDNGDAAQTLRDVLELNQHTVEVANNGADGLAKARRFVPDVVLCDIGLPGMNGHDVAREIRADPLLRSAYLVAISGFAASEDLAAAKMAGFDRHLAKPPPLEHIEQILNELPTSPS